MSTQVRVAGAVAAVAWCVFVVGIALSALTVPVYTSAATAALGVPRTAGLSPADVVKLSGRVRAFVSDAEAGELPATWRGRPAFDHAAVAHLRDVRAVMTTARLATGVAALLLSVLVSWCIARRRLDLLRTSMTWGAIAIAGIMLVAVAAGAFDFSSLFASFHGLFFASGTWTFPFDSLLIRLFPERFWVASAGVWAGLSVVGAALLLIAARLMRTTAARQHASRTPNYV